MKKFLLLALVVCLALALVACKQPVDDNGGNTPACTDHVDDNYDGVCDNDGCGAAVEVDVLTHAEYIAAELDSHVVIDAYVQAHQSWWDNKITVYLADEDGAYFAYEMACSEEDAAKLTPGTKIRVYGYKAEWSGEVEITECAFNFLGDDTYVAEPVDLTAVLPTEELINYQNALAIFRGLEIVSIEYKGGNPGNDIYVTVRQGEYEFDFCVESYLTAPDSDVYAAVGALQPGDIVDVEGFVYWYNGVNTHITAVTKYTTQAEYEAADLDSEVLLVSYVQAKQSWWDNKGTFYLQSADGAVFAYEMACSEELYNTLTVGTRVAVHGYKAAWKGEVEVMDGEIYYLGGDTYVAEPVDITDKLGTEELINYQNQYVKFTDMTLVAAEYKNEQPGDDIYLTFEKDGEQYSFCVEVYLTGTSTDLYKLFTQGTLLPGDVVDVECFLYWYDGANPHVTAITNINE